MATIRVPQPEPLGRKVLLKYLRVQRLTDRELNAILRETAREANRFIAGLSDAPSNAVRRAQIHLAQQQVEMWARVNTSIRTGAGNAGEAAAELMAQFDKPYLRSLGIDPLAWERAQVATARRGVLNYLARGVNNVPLSTRVYRNGLVSSGRIDSIINSGLLLGKSAREIAQAVAKYISPSTPGGVSYAAMRLGRTELNNAFHRLSIEKYEQTPWVDAVKWNLSGSHPKADECDGLAGDQHFKGGGPGEFMPDDVPGKPHPHCLCFVEPVPVSENAFVRAFHAGRYDDYLDSLVPTRSQRIA